MTGIASLTPRTAPGDDMIDFASPAAWRAPLQVTNAGHRSHLA
jgi:hypothetical protein